MSFSLTSKAALFSCLALALVACGDAATPEEGDAEQSEDALVNAPRDTKNTWAVGVCASAPNTDPAKGAIGACVQSGTRCTGSLVAPNLVLTARHCTNEIDWNGAAGFCDGKFTSTPLSTAGVRVTLGSSVLAENPTWITASQVLVPTGVSACDDDIALVVLSANVPGTDATPISLQLENLGTKWWLRPSKVAVVGRGILTALIDPVELAPIDEEANGGLERRYAENIPFRCISNQPGRCSVTDITSPPSNKFTLSLGQFLIGKGGASGDSGSAILDQKSFSSSKPVAVGVFSAGTYAKTGVSNAGLGVRLDQHAAWLRAGAQQASTAGAYTLPTWAK